MAVETFTIPSRPVLLSSQRLVEQKVVIAASEAVDSGSTPTTRLRQGMVLGKLSTGKYGDGAVTAPDGAVQATVTGTVDLSGTTTALQSKTFIFRYKDGPAKTVTLGAGDDTLAEVVTALNANADFSRWLFAEASGNNLKLTLHEGGADAWFTITTGTVNTVAGFTNNQTFTGSEASYGVLLEVVDLVDGNNTARDVQASIALSGHFDESQLLWPVAGSGQAKAALARAGSIFG